MVRTDLLYALCDSGFQVIYVQEVQSNIFLLTLKTALANKNSLLLSRHIMKDNYLGGEAQIQSRSRQQRVGGSQGRIEILF